MTSPAAPLLDALDGAVRAAPAAAIPRSSVPGPDRPEPVACPECGAAINERFCGRCGETRPVDGALRLRHLAGELVEHLTSLDFKLLRTLATLLRRPGQLTRDFVAGRRHRHARPLALYLLVSGAFFLLSPHLPAKGADPRSFIDGRHPSPVLARYHDAVARRHGETRTTMADRVARSPFVGSRYSAALLVPALGAVLTLLLAGRRRLVAEHVLFAIHTQCFLLLLMAVSLGSVYLLGRVSGWIGKAVGIPHPSDRFVTVATASIVLASIAWLAGHLHAALRRVYALRRWGAAWRAAVIVVAIPLAWSCAELALVEVVAISGLH